MNLRSTLTYILTGGFVSLLLSAQAATNTVSHVYPCGADIAVKIGQDLVATLDQKFQPALNPDVVVVANSDAPIIAPVQESRRDLPHQISVSTGFIDLLNHIAHAKAIDRIQPGYFREYVDDLGRESAGFESAPPPSINDPRYWSPAVMQEQASFFNQMISITLALNLSHVYLDHCHKYAASMTLSKSGSINDFIAPSEWQASVKHAAANSLDCALSTAGAVALFDCIDHMPCRPAWASYIVPHGVNVKKLNKELTQCENDYYITTSSLLHRRRSWTWVGPKDDPSNPLAVRRFELGPN